MHNFSLYFVDARILVISCIKSEVIFINEKGVIK